MNRINEYSFSSLYDISSGISTSKSQAGHGSPFASFSTVFNNYFLPEELPDLMASSKKEQEIYSIKEGDILLTRTSETIDELAMSCIALKDYPEATFSGFTKRLRPKPEAEKVTYHKYLGFYLRGYLFRQTVTNHSIMTLRSSFNEEIFALLKIYLPEYEEQVKIGDFLYTLAQKIQLNNAINAELEKVVKTLYNYWFVQFDFPNAKGKPYHATGGKMEYNEVLKREIPEGWKAERFIDLATITTGKEDANFSTPDRIYNFFTCGRDILRCDKSAFSGQAVLLAGNGDFNVKHYTGEFNAYQRTYVLIPKHSAHYAAMYIAASDKVAELKRGAYGSIVKFITMSDVANIALPVNHRYNYLFENLTVIINEIELLERENDELIKLRDFLLPLLMNGQVRVREEATHRKNPTKN
jgi:type I restriction enzyme S subunit